jgi:hypothetical protein
MKRILLALTLAFTLGCVVPVHAQAQPPYNSIYLGKSAGFKFLFLANGNTYTGTFVPTVVWTCSDTTATLVPGPDTTTLEITIPLTDINTSLTCTASTTAPDGITKVTSTSIPITILPEPIAYTGAVIWQSGTN